MFTMEREDNEKDEALVEVATSKEANGSIPPQLSFHALTGTYSFQTMRIKGAVGMRIMYLLIAREGHTISLMRRSPSNLVVFWNQWNG